MTLLLQQLEASHWTYWTQGHVFADEICTDSVHADVPGFRLHLSRTGWWRTPGRDDSWANFSTVIFTYFMMNVEIVDIHFTLISSGCTYCSQEIHRFHQDIFYAILFFSVRHFFYLFSCVHFSIKISNWSLTRCHFLVLLKMQVLLTGWREIQSSSLLTTRW